MKNKLRAIAVATSALIAMTAFTGCSTANSSATSGGSGSSATNQKVTLRVLTTFAGTDAYAPTFKAALEQFKAKYPNVTISDESMSGDGDPIRVKVKTEFSSGNEPDVLFYFAQSEAETLVKSGRLMSFDTLLSQDKTWGDSFLPSALSQMKVNDKIYSLPLVGIYEQMFYNKDLFDKNGLTIPKTWDDLKKDITVFKDKGIVPIANSMKDNWCVLSESLVAASGSKGVNSTFKNGVNKDWATALNSIKELYDLGAFPKDSLTLQDSVAQQLFVSKKAAMMFNGSWAVANIKDQSNVVVQPMPVPAGGSGNEKEIVAGFTSGYFLSTDSYNDKNKQDMGLKLVKFLTSGDVVKSFVKASGAPTGIKLTGDLGISKLAQQGDSYVTNADSVALSLDALIPSESYSEISNGIPFIITGKKTADDVLKSAYQVYQSKQ